MFNLIKKDFRLFFPDYGHISKKISTALFISIIVALFIGIEVYVFTTILNKIKIYQNAATAFFSIFLFVIVLLVTLAAVLNASKLFFNEQDFHQMMIYPISNVKKIATKLVFLFFFQYFLNVCFAFPLFISYGMILNVDASFYVLMLCYPILSFLFEAGVAMILVYPYKLISTFLKNHLIVQFITMIILIAGGVYLYGNFLTLFMSLVSNNEMDQLFTITSIERLIKLGYQLFPSNYLVMIFTNFNVGIFFTYVAIMLAVFLFGLGFLSLFYTHFNQSIQRKQHSLQKKMQVYPPIFTLIKKEFILLFKDSSYIFTFTGLLLVEPFLSYLICHAMSTVFTHGIFAYYIMVLPNFIPLVNIVFLVLISIIINKGANQYITMEKNNVRLLKTLPVKATTQLLIKVSIPFLLSLIFSLGAFITLYVTNIIDSNSFIIGFVVNILLLFAVDIISLYEELKQKNNGSKNTLLSTIYSYLLILIFFIISLVLSYFNFDIWIVFFISVGILVLLTLPFLICIRSRVKRLFDALEVSN